MDHELIRKLDFQDIFKKTNKNQSGKACCGEIVMMVFNKGVFVQNLIIIG